MPFQAKAIIVVAAGLALLVGAFMLADWAAEYLWLETLGYASVFWSIRSMKLGFFLFAFVPVFFYVWINLRLVSRRLDFRPLLGALLSLFSRRATPGGPFAAVRDGRAAQPTGAFAGDLRYALATLSTIAAFAFGAVLYNHWERLLLFRFSQQFGTSDPIFGHDIGFYVFVVPLLELIQDAVLAATLIGTAAVVAAYMYAGVIRFHWRDGIEAPADALRHAAANVALFLVALAWGFHLDRFELLLSERGAVFGAGYTDVVIMRPALWVMVGATLALALAVLVPPVLRKLGMSLVTVGGYVVILVVGIFAAPWLVQVFEVEPNELELEAPYLRHNIRFTRQAFGLDQVVERTYDVTERLAPAALARNHETIDNIRLWDWQPLSQTFRQLQQIRTYYEFYDVDVDRYRIGADYRQVMVSARELSGQLPAKAETWVNRHLQYTHGYGLAMSLAAKKTEEGAPVLVIRDVPPKSDDGIAVDQPAIYYGENMYGYRIVNTAVKEFNHPRGDANVYAHYDGSGGVSLGSFFRRALFAFHQFDVRILLTSYITADSRIQFWRDVQDRVRRVAPFLALDRDPYLVLSDGRLFWVQDAYTVSETYPYSEPYRDHHNYIRNSVKVIVDAYLGEVAIYVMDPEDPVLGAYRAALPVLFRPLNEMPDGLRRHLRYPQDLFEAQVEKYSTFHMTVPQVFYNGEDVWEVPRQIQGFKPMSLRPIHALGDEYGVQQHMSPYFVLMKLLGEDRVQFLLMTPMTPANRDNMIAWIAARSDFPGYGELIAYKLPKERLILGPIQVQAMIDQDTQISQQISLWDQRGSRMIRGHLLVIPIEQSFLYVKPVYLIAEGTDIPQLKRVIVSDGDRIAMEPTLEQAVASVFGRTPSRPGLAAGLAPGAPDSRPAAREALLEAEKALRDGNWDAFGRAMQALKLLLEE
ncbi:MAG: UPF0182 family protein [Rhodospirillales bacterium]|nr:UPF0182 family protein [Rhodospirillales bacterium]